MPVDGGLLLTLPICTRERPSFMAHWIFPWNYSEWKYKSLFCYYRFSIFKRKREKKIMARLMLPKEQWV